LQKAAAADVGTRIGDIAVSTLGVTQRIQNGFNERHNWFLTEPQHEERVAC
jgi:hypothetical protein